MESYLSSSVIGSLTSYFRQVVPGVLTGEIGHAQCGNHRLIKIMHMNRFILDKRTIVEKDLGEESTMEEINCIIIDNGDRVNPKDRVPLQMLGLLVCLRSARLRRGYQKTLFRYERNLIDITSSAEGDKPDHDPYIRRSSSAESPLTIVFRFPTGLPDTFEVSGERAGSLEYLIYAQDVEGILYTAPIQKKTVTEMCNWNVGRQSNLRLLQQQPPVPVAGTTRLTSLLGRFVRIRACLDQGIYSVGQPIRIHCQLWNEGGARIRRLTISLIAIRKITIGDWSHKWKTVLGSQIKNLGKGDSNKKHTNSALSGTTMQVFDDHKSVLTIDPYERAGMAPSRHCQGHQIIPTERLRSCVTICPWKFILEYKIKVCAELANYPDLVIKLPFGMIGDKEDEKRAHPQQEVTPSREEDYYEKLKLYDRIQIICWDSLPNGNKFIQPWLRMTWKREAQIAAKIFHIGSRRRPSYLMSLLFSSLSRRKRLETIGLELAQIRKCLTNPLLLPTDLASGRMAKVSEHLSAVYVDVKCTLAKDLACVREQATLASLCQEWSIILMHCCEGPFESNKLLIRDQYWPNPKLIRLIAFMENRVDTLLSNLEPKVNGGDEN